MAATILFPFLKFLTFLLLAVSASQDSKMILRKCCAEEEFLDADNNCTDFNYYSETNMLHRFPVPLRIYGQDFFYTCPNSNNTDIESVDTNFSDFCIDKMLIENIKNNNSLINVPDSFINIKLCNNNNKKNNINNTKITVDLKPYLINIKKCCSEQYSYNPELHSCQNETSNLNDIIGSFYNNEQKYINIDHSFFKCSGVIIDYKSTDYIIEIKDNEDLVLQEYEGVRTVISKDSYCIDSTNDSRIVARVCQDMNRTCSENTCIRKCCPFGYTYQLNKRNKTDCLPGYATFMPQFHDFYPSLKKVNMTNYPFATATGIHCEMGKYIMTKSEEHVFGRNGFIYILKTNLSFSYGGKYCVEHVQRPNFAPGLHTFLCFPTKFPYKNDKGVWYAIPTVLSCIFLLATLFVYVYLKELRNLHGKTLMCHVGSTLIAYICLAYLSMGVTAKNPVSKVSPEVCIAIGFILLHTFLMSFSWLNIMCFDIWWTFGRRSALGLLKKDIREWRRLLWYCLYACGVPTLITIAAVICDYTRVLPPRFRPSIGSPRCFTDFRTMGSYIFFIIPITIQIVCNSILFIMTAVHCSRIKSEIHRMQSKSKKETQNKFIADRAKFFMNIKLFLVMGIPWVHEIISTLLNPTSKIWFVGDMINCLLGVFIFIIFVCKMNVLKLLCQRMGIQLKCFRSTPTTTSTDPYKTKSINSTASTLMRHTSNY